jgi:hypothetical protein
MDPCLIAESSFLGVSDMTWAERPSHTTVGAHGESFKLQMLGKCSSYILFNHFDNVRIRFRIE